MSEPPAPKRVLRLITRLNIGGPARQALSLSRTLAPEFRTLLAAGTPDPTEGELSDPSIPVTKISLTRSVSPSNDLRAIRSAKDLLDRERPHILHTHMAKAGAVGRIAARNDAAAPKTVHTFHGHVLDGYFSRPVREGFVRIERWLARHTDALVAVSKEIRDELLDLEIGRTHQWHVIPLGFDLSRFLDDSATKGQLRDRIGIDESTRLLGIVGRLVPIKDHATSFRALSQLPDDVHLAVLGDGALRIELQGLATSLGLGGRIHFVGWWDDMPSAMRDLDLVILTSRNEGSPVALIEAGAAAVPVVATDVGGVRSVVSHGETGFLVSAGDDNALASRITQLLDAPTLRAQMGSKARERIPQRYGLGRLTSDVKALYGSLLEES